MGGTIADLLITLGKSIGAFNEHNEAAVKENLAPNIVVGSVRTEKTLRGTDGINNITNNFKDNPTFTLVRLDIDLKGDNDGTATKATLTGKAKWKDNHDPKKPENIQFTFDCVFMEKNWSFQKVVADIV